MYDNERQVTAISDNDPLEEKRKSITCNCEFIVIFTDHIFLNVNFIG